MSSHKTPTIVLFGSTGFAYRNIGDLATVVNVVSNLRKALPRLEIVFLSNKPEATGLSDGVSIKRSMGSFLMNETTLVRWLTGRLSARYHGVRMVQKICKVVWLLGNVVLLKAFRMTFIRDEGGQEFLRAIKGADVMFAVGGGYINTVWPYYFIEICLTALVGAYLGKPVIMSGQSIGPVDGRWSQFLLKYCLRRVELVTVRDGTQSLAILDYLRFAHPCLFSTCDDALTLVAAEAEAETFIKRHLPAQDAVIMGINVRDSRHYKLRPTIDHVEAFWGELLDAIAENLNVRYVFIPMQDIDERTALDVICRMKHRDRALCLPLVTDPHLAKGIIGRMDLALGVSYHFLIFAMSMGVPAIGLFLDEYYRIKTCGACEVFGCPEWAIPVRAREDIVRIVEQVTECLEHRDSLSQHLQAMTDRLSERSLVAICRAKDMMVHEYPHLVEAES